MSQHEQSVIDRDHPVRWPGLDGRDGGVSQSALDVSIAPTEAAERAARDALRAQIARLERELSGIVAERFPHLPARARLASALQRARRCSTSGDARALARSARGRRAGTASARERARRARAPRARAARADEARAGPLQVRAAARQRPRAGRMRRLGGAPASRSDRHARRLVAAQALVRLSVSQGVALQARPRFTEPEHRRERAALALGHRPDRLLLGHRYLGEELATAGLSPAALAHQQIGDSHAVGLPRAFEDHLGHVRARRSPPGA